MYDSKISSGRFMYYIDIIINFIYFVIIKTEKVYT